MAIEVTCGDCQQTMMVKDSFAGKKGLCPKCKAAITVPELPPVPEPEPFQAPTEKQIDYAQVLGISIPEGVSRKQLSQMISDAKDGAPASENQKSYPSRHGRRVPREHQVESNQHAD